MYEKVHLRPQFAVRLVLLASKPNWLCLKAVKTSKGLPCLKIRIKTKSTLN
jgi:hypothetical protein